MNRLLCLLSVVLSVLFLTELQRLVVGSLQDTPDDPHFLLYTTFHCLPHCTSVGLSGQWYMAEIMICPFWYLLVKGTWLSQWFLLSLSLVVCSGWNQLPSHPATDREGHIVRNWDFQEPHKQPSKWIFWPQMSPSSPRWYFRQGYTHSGQLNWNLISQSLSQNNSAKLFPVSWLSETKR